LAVWVTISPEEFSTSGMKANASSPVAAGVSMSSTLARSRRRSIMPPEYGASNLNLKVTPGRAETRLRRSVAVRFCWAIRPPGRTDVPRWITGSPAVL
jgi:hypothetical protein